MKKHLYLIALIALIFNLLSCVSDKNNADDGIKTSIEHAAQLIDLQLAAGEVDSMATGIESYLNDYKRMHQLHLPNATRPALVFDPIPVGWDHQPKIKGNRLRDKASLTYDTEEGYAFMTVEQLSEMIRNQQVSSVELTSFFLDRLEQYSDTLKCTVEILKDRAMRSAEKADEEIAAGNYRGALHGIPYGVKDLLNVAGTASTYGVSLYTDNTFEADAHVVQALEEAGAILCAKLSLGELAMGDVWFGGVTKNPWNLEQGSSGSSAGSASAVSAGLLPFAIGSETLGSIISPATRCGVSGIRPTFGRVGKSGGMALSWSMDKLGPIARTIYDANLVLEAISGKDKNDISHIEKELHYDFNSDRKLKIGYLDLMDTLKYPAQEDDQKVLQILRDKGHEVVPTSFTTTLPGRELVLILMAEGAAAFSELTLTKKDAELVQQHQNAWPNLFRAARFIPAVEYIQANRFRTALMKEFDTFMREYDVLVCPPYLGNILVTTNLTGHPAVVIPHGFASENSPHSITFIGNLFDEGAITHVADQVQRELQFHRQTPNLNF
ncbi:MAG: amidase [Cyclobacteriaceae bacterium]|nr:amidase [Cyclobacteriaceae bacterium]MCH8516676.1 amidase [Cyclobacteriaceae bacterium]